MTSKAIIAYDNLLVRSAATVTASSQRDGFSAANAWDWRTTTYWSPTSSGVQTITAVFASPVTADYFSIYRHNLGSVNGVVRLQYSVDAGSTWADAFGDQDLTDNQLLLKTFDPVSASYWRVRFYCLSATPLVVGVLMLGPLLRLYRGMPAGFLPARQSRRNQVINSLTDGGQFAGRSIIPMGAETVITVKAVPPGWIRASWEPFQRHAEKYPFLFSWNHDYRPDDACWCVVPDNFPEPGPIDENFRQSISLPVKCLLSGE